MSQGKLGEGEGTGKRIPSNQGTVVRIYVGETWSGRRNVIDKKEEEEGGRGEEGQERKAKIGRKGRSKGPLALTRSRSHPDASRIPAILHRGKPPRISRDLSGIVGYGSYIRTGSSVTSGHEKRVERGITPLATQFDHVDMVKLPLEKSDKVYM